MNNKISKNLAIHRLEQAKEEYKASILLYENNFLKSANNRAYYSIFHSIKAVLSLEPVDFKKHKDVIAYFNQKYINMEIFPKKLGHKISLAQATREDSDYDDEYVVSREKTKSQIDLAKELLLLVEIYINNNQKNEK